MPFTPFHLGPGLLLKGLFPKRVSLLAFGASQVAIDLESLYHLVRHEWPVHRSLHTLPVAGLVGAATGLISCALGRVLPARLSRAHASLYQSELGLWPAVLGGLLGGASHPLLDGLMHSDVRPFMPFATVNPFLGVVSVATLHLLCVMTGAAGVATLIGRRELRGRTERRRAAGGGERRIE